MAKSKFLSASPSAVDTHLSCPRKRWFQRACKMPEPPRKATTFGDVCHNVLERYLDNKEMYPVGWEFPVNRFTGKKAEKGLNVSEQRMAKALIQAGIDQGTINREPDGTVEKKNVQELFDKDGVKCMVYSYIDYATPECVQDHKFVKDAKYYSPSKLKKAVPMLYYAACQIAEYGLPPDGTYWLQYNVFVKGDSLKTKKVRAEVKNSDVMQWFEEVYAPACEEMALITKRNPSEEEWASVKGEDPDGVGYSACEEYGGCAYKSICSGVRSPKQYREGFDKGRDEKRDKAIASATGNEGSTMASFRDRVKKNKAAADAAPKTETTAPEQAAPAENPVPLQDENKPAAPWYHPACTSCADSAMYGVSAKTGKACAICNLKGKKVAGRPKAVDYTIESEGTAIVVKLKATGEVVVTTGDAVVTSTEVLDVVEPVEPEAPVEEKKVEPEPKPEVAKPKASTAKEQELASEDEGAPFDKANFKQDRKDFVLSYAPIRSRQRSSAKVGAATCIMQIGDVYDLFEQMVVSEKPELQSLSSLRDLDKYAMFKANGAALAEVLGSSEVDASAALGGNDFCHLCSAIEQYAKKVYGSL